MNKVFLIGNLTRDPEMSETNSGITMCRFAIAFNVTAWRGLAETVGKYCKKGNKVAVSGSIQIRNYEDNQGNRRTAVDVVAQDIEFLTSRNQSSGDDFYDSPAPAKSAPKKKPADLESFDDDGDIPF